MAEPLSTTKVDINPLTGLPYGGSPTVETSGPVDIPINPLTGVAFNNTAPTYNQRNDNSQLYGSQYTTYRKDNLEKYTDYGVPLGQDLDWDEIRARNQSTSEKWGRGLAKAGVTTLGAVAENTLGVIAGLGEVFTGGAYYDNSVGNTIDKTNAWMQEYMPNYRTQEERDMGTLQKLGTANFWGETVAGGLGYSVGSIATMWLTGGTGMLTKGMSAGAKAVGIYNASKAVINGTALGTKLAKGAGLANRLKSASNSLEVGAMMSLAEASVESRETQKSTYDGLVEEYLSERPGSTISDIPSDMLNDFEEVSYAAGNTNFAIQMPVLMGTNLLMFGKQVAGFKGVSKKSKDVLFDAASKQATNTLAEKGIVGSTLQRLKPLALSGLEETFQESMQFGSGAFSSTYHTDKYHNGGYGDMSKALTAAGEAMLSPEGLESALVGFLTGGIMGGGQSIVGKAYSNRKQQAQMLTDLVNQGIFENTQVSAQNADASAKAASDMDKHLKDGNLKKFKDAQFKLIQYQALEAKNRGGLHLIMEKLEDARGLSETEFMKQFGYPTEDAQGNALSLADSGDKSQEAIIDGFKKKLINFEKVHDSVTKQFPLEDKTKGLPRKLMSAEARKAEDNVYAQQQNLRTQLILFGSEINDRTRRMGEIAKTMQTGLTESLFSQPLSFSTSNTTKDSRSLDEALKDQYKTPGEVEGSEFDALDQMQETSEKLNKIAQELKTSNPTMFNEFIEQSNDYMALMGENNVAIDRYNKLASDKYVQDQMQKEIEIAETEAKQNRTDKELTAAVKNAATKKDLIDLDSENASPEVQREYDKKLAEFRDAEAAAFRKYMEEKPGETPQQLLTRLEELDKKDLTPSEIEGLSQAIEVLKGETSEGTPEAATQQTSDTKTDRAEETGEPVETPEKELFTNEEEETRKAAQIAKNSNENNNTEQQTTPGTPIKMVSGPRPAGMTDEDLRDLTNGAPIQEGFSRPTPNKGVVVETVVFDSPEQTSGIRTIAYTPKGKTKQTYTIEGAKIYNQKGIEVFKKDSIDRNKIFANLAVREGRAVVVKYKDSDYIVNNKEQIISAATGKLMEWAENNGDRIAILSLAPTQPTSEVKEDGENTGTTDLEIKAANTDRVVPVGEKWRIQVNGSDNPVMYPANTIEGEPIEINRDLLLDPNVKEKVVTFEIISDDYYKSLGEETSESWKKIPIYYKIDNEYVGKLVESDSLERKEIVDQLVAGNKVTTKISDIIAGPKNINNTLDESNAKAFRNPELTFGKNEVILGIVTKSIIRNGVISGPIDDFLDQGDLPFIEGAFNAPQSIENLGNGQVVAAIRPKNNPQGDARITPLLTANITADHADRVMRLLKDGQYDDVKEIIATSAVPSDSNKYMSIDSYPDGSVSLTYKSEITGGVVRIKDYYLNKMFRKESYKFDDMKFKDGDFIKYKADRGDKTLDILKDLTEAIKGKKYHVDNDRINLAGDYTSPLTDKEYISTATEPFGYQQYLFSDTELSGEKSILSTDVIKIGESLFNNPGVTFNKVSITDSTGVTKAPQQKKKIKLIVAKKVKKSTRTAGINRDDIGFEEDPNSCI
jgi:hypothetical protein